MKKLITICAVTAMFIVGNNPSFADPVAITLKSDASTLAAALGPGAPPPDVLARLDTPDISGLAFLPVLVGSYGTATLVPPGAPPGDGENGYFMMSFQFPDVFDNIQLTGVANVDDFGRVFLNGHPLTAPIGRGVSEYGNVAFGTSDPSLFQTGENTILISVANTGGPSGGAFFVNITFDSASGSALSVTPSDGLSSSGVQGGPFSPGSKAYTLTNTSEQSLAWTADKTQNWVTLDQTSGALAGGASTTSLAW
jgi:hypothetical protein